MAGGPNIPFFSQYEEYRGRNRKVNALDLPEGVIITPVVPLRVYPWGRYLNLPPHSAAIINSPRGDRFLREVGGMLDELEPGEYGVQFVDKKRQVTSIRKVQARSKDAWMVTLSIEIAWRIGDPLKIAEYSRPYNDLINLGRAAIMNYISTCEHDTLVASPETSPMSESVIGEGIKSRLEKNPALDGFHIINVNVLEREGDPDRIGKIQAGRASQLEVESNRIAAVSEAELETRINEILRPIEEQKVQIEQMQKEQDLKHEQFLEVLKVSGAAFQELASVLTQAQMTPGLHHDLDNRAIEMMLTGLDNLTRSITSGGIEPGTAIKGNEINQIPPNDFDPGVLPAMDMDHLE